MNKIILIGNLTKEPFAGSTNNDKRYCKFSIAVNRRFGEGVDYFNVLTWNALAENCEKYLSKGKKVAVSGRLEFGTYEKDGQTKQTTDVIADEVEFLSPIQQDKPKADPEQLHALVSVEGEDLPF